MPVFLAFDNRNLGTGYVGISSDVELEAGISLYQTLASRTICQCNGIYNEFLADHRFGCFIPQTSEIAKLVLWEGLSLGALSDCLKPNCTLTQDAWKGFMSSVLSIIKLRKKEFIRISQESVSLTFITNDVALYGNVGKRQNCVESIRALSEQLRDVRKTVVNISVNIVCVNLSRRHPQDLDSSENLDALLLQTEALLHSLFADDFDHNNSTSICRIENSSIHFEAELRLLVSRCKPLVQTKLEFPRTHTFKASIDIEICPATLQALIKLHSGLSRMQILSLIPNNGIDSIALDGQAMLIRPAILVSSSR